MTVPRMQIVAPAVTPYYHCISRCVRRLFLCGDGSEHRKVWIEQRLQQLAEIFAIEVCSYGILDNHFHVVLKLNESELATWSDEQVALKWAQLFPPRSKDRKPTAPTSAWLQDRLNDKQWLNRIRGRLNNLGWFMKCLKEPIARRANKEDNARGAFWEARFKSIAILDEEALLTTLAYVDLNVMAAGKAKTPESSRHTSIRKRIEDARRRGVLDRLKKAEIGPPAERQSLEDEDFWLIPLRDNHRSDGGRHGISTVLDLRSYLQLLDWSGRLGRPGKAKTPRDVKGILERIGSQQEVWEARLTKLQNQDQIAGVMIATSPSSLQQVKAQRGISKLTNVAGPLR